MPMVLIDTAQGTAKLSQFDFIKKIIKDNKDLDVVVVFTKFLNGKNDMENKLRESEEDIMNDLLL